MSKTYGLSPSHPKGMQTVLAPDETATNDQPIVFWDDFLAYDAAATTVGEWLETLGGTSGAVTQNGSVGGALMFNIGHASDNFLSLQEHSLGFLCAAGKDTVIETRVKCTDGALTQFMIGLGAVDALSITAAANFIGFRFSADVLTCLSEKASAETTTVSTVTLVDATYAKLRVEIDGVSTARFYVDDVLVATHTTNIPIVGMTQTIEVGGSSTSADAIVDYILINQDR